ncbi:hypothetical protein [Pseudomonas sp. W2Jun17]|uniref:hypothetical protein n=1 Tax=Pseudomonas sp. W2Jun17 TaxID=1553460 RepID=UPI002004A39C|nr:hypothetical protein [Pseudomonas sp. W2Jun17]MCK3849976.1 hypothetical protein [Pseudomonas sp. W2Jun17]
MSEVKRYHVTEAGLVEGSALGRINVVLASDYDAAVTHIRDLELLAGQEMKSTELATNAGLRVCLERDALQALLTAADERADVLESALKFYAGRDHYSIDDGLNWDSCSGEPANILWHEDQPWFIEDGSIARAALKPSEGSTCNQIREESGLPVKTPCQACGHGACIDR